MSLCNHNAAIWLKAGSLSFNGRSYLLLTDSQNRQTHLRLYLLRVSPLSQCCEFLLYLYTQCIKRKLILQWKVKHVVAFCNHIHYFCRQHCKMDKDHSKGVYSTHLQSQLIVMGLCNITIQMFGIIMFFQETDSFIKQGQIDQKWR